LIRRLTLTALAGIVAVSSAAMLATSAPALADRDDHHPNWQHRDVHRDRDWRGDRNRDYNRQYHEQYGNDRYRRGNGDWNRSYRYDRDHHRDRDDHPHR
jgi:Ni/Co efflux regulator RcnB